jgi:hypothetical protein
MFSKYYVSNGMYYTTAMSSSWPLPDVELVQIYFSTIVARCAVVAPAYIVVVKLK